MSTPESESILELNKRLLCRFFDEAWNKGRREVIKELFAKTGILHDGGRQFHGPAGFTHFYDIMRGHFSQISIRPIVALAEGDLVCVRWSADCVHTPTRTTVNLTGISIVRIKDGQFIEAWQNWDAAGLLAQIPGLSLPY
jgi:predicted SnoaL-like aldol condensation-catalyzing enzyme